MTLPDQRCVFVDCNDALAAVIAKGPVSVPSGLTIHRGTPTDAELKSICKEANVILVEQTAISASVIQACPSLRKIIFMGTGAAEYIDLDHAAARGINVTTIANYANRTIAEHTFALILAAARQVCRMDRELRSGVWQPLNGLELSGRKMAVIGLGGIGTCVADIANAFGMEVAAWNRSVSEHSNYVESLNQCLRGADVVSLHLAMNPATKGILGVDELQLPNHGFILANTARWALVDEKALLSGLSSGQVGHAAMDVFADEPLPIDHFLTTLMNVTLTAHSAYMSDTAYENLWNQTLVALEEAQRH